MEWRMVRPHRKLGFQRAAGTRFTGIRLSATPKNCLGRLWREDEVDFEGVHYA